METIKRRLYKEKIGQPWHCECGEVFSRHTPVVNEHECPQGELKMRTIWKFPIHKAANQYGEVKLELPGWGRILKVDMQGGVPTAWVEIDPATEKIERSIFIVGTGKEIPEKARKYICTFFEDPYVWHVYE